MKNQINQGPTIPILFIWIIFKKTDGFLHLTRWGGEGGEGFVLVSFFVYPLRQTIIPEL